MEAVDIVNTVMSNAVVIVPSSCSRDMQVRVICCGGT